MASIKIYNGEYFERGQLRYVFFAFVFGGLITLSLIYGNYVGAVVLILFVGGYLFFSAITTQTIDAMITNNSLNIGDRQYPWKDVQGFTFEVKTLKDGSEIRNIIFIINNKNYIHTIRDDLNKVRDFVGELSKYTQLLDNVFFSTSEKISRSLKL